jgi:di/tripeptidase
MEEDLKKLRYELNGTQKALEVQANILQRVRTEDSKRIREQKARCQHLELQITRYKRQMEATSRISADYQRRYLQDVDEAKRTIQQDYEARLRIGFASQ